MKGAERGPSEGSKVWKKGHDEGLLQTKVAERRRLEDTGCISNAFFLGEYSWSI